MQLTVGCWAANLIASMYVKVTSLLLSKKKSNGAPKSTLTPLLIGNRV